MKKFLVVLVVLTLVGLASIALAADVTMGGSVQIRSRNFQSMTYDKNSTSSGATTVDTQERVIIDVNAKAGDNLKGKISLWNDWDTWQRFENVQGYPGGFGKETTNTGGHFGFREAWMSFNLPDIPVNVTVGHQLLTLGNGWFFRSSHFGSDAWVISNKTGNNTLGFINVKVGEGTSSAYASDDSDAYVLFDVLKLNDNMSVGIDISDVKFRANSVVSAPTQTNTELQNIGLNFNGKLGAVNLKAEADFQMGKVDAWGGNPEQKFKGMQLVVQGNVAMDPLTINFLLGYGTGQDLESNTNDIEQYVNLLDTDPRYTFLYEYKLNTAANGGPYSAGIGGTPAKNTGMANTTALGAGVMFAVSKSLNLGLDAYYLQATEKIPNGMGEMSDKIGTEIDAKIYWKLYDNLTWNWDLGYFMPGDAYKTAAGKTDAATGIQGVLAFKF